VNMQKTTGESFGLNPMTETVIEADFNELDI
jgi:hypothetical protein